MNHVIISLIDKLTIWNISRKIEKMSWHSGTVISVGRPVNLKIYLILQCSIYWCYREYFEMLCKIMKTKTYSDKWFSSALILNHHLKGSVTFICQFEWTLLTPMRWKHDTKELLFVLVTLKLSTVLLTFNAPREHPVKQLWIHTALPL